MRRAPAPAPADPYVRVQHAGHQYAVWFDAGRPAWVALVWYGHGPGVAERVETLSSDSPLMQAARAAVAFLDGFRLPAVAA